MIINILSNGLLVLVCLTLDCLTLDTHKLDLN